MKVDEFWNQNSSCLPNLSKIAKKYIGLYPSSSCIERAFSMAKNVLDDRFGAIDQENAEKKIFLYINNNFK